LRYALSASEQDGTGRVVQNRVAHRPKRRIGTPLPPVPADDEQRCPRRAIQKRSCRAIKDHDLLDPDMRVQAAGLGQLLCEQRLGVRLALVPVDVRIEAERFEGQIGPRMDGDHTATASSCDVEAAMHGARAGGRAVDTDDYAGPAVSGYVPHHRDGHGDAAGQLSGTRPQQYLRARGLPGSAQYKHGRLRAELGKQIDLAAGQDLSADIDLGCQLPAPFHSGVYEVVRRLPHATGIANGRR
jgi:hypothetical protein